MLGRPAQLNSASTTLPILATAASICVGLAQVGLGEAREAGDVGLLDVDRVHLGAELDEQLGRGRAHARRRAAHDHPLAFVAEHVLHRVPPGALGDGYSIVIACSGQLSAPSRAWASSASADLLPRARRSGRSRRSPNTSGREHVAATVTDAEVGVDANFHHARGAYPAPRRGRTRRRAAYAPPPCAARDATASRRDRRRDRDRGRVLEQQQRTARRRRRTPTPTSKPATLPARLDAAPQPGPGARLAQQLPRVAVPAGARRAREGRTPATAAGLDYGHRPLARAVRPRRPPDRARRVVRPEGRQVRAPVAAEDARTCRRPTRR